LEREVIDPLVHVVILFIVCHLRSLRKQKNLLMFSSAHTNGISTDKSFKEETIDRQWNRSLHDDSRLIDLLLSEEERAILSYVI
jgi:hypothetical protein